jgi:signal transduction histidine kinase/CheY-like chemotaxis protein/streptogramin lyase
MFRRPIPISRALALLLALAGTAAAQQYSFRLYGESEGLQNLAILSLAQDGQGFIWAGSEAGLYRYDGTRFRLMSAAEGLPCTSEAQSLHVASDGALWASTCSRLFRFDGQAFQPIPGVGEMLSRAQAMADGPRGALIVATARGLLELVPDASPQTFQAHPHPVPPHLTGKRVRGILLDGPRLWFGCDRRLCVEQDTHFKEYGEEQGLPADSWDSIGVENDGTVWVRSPDKLYRKPPGAGRFLREEVDVPSSMYWGALTVEPDGTILMPTDGGLAIRQNGRWMLIDESRGLRFSMVSCVLRDREGSFWLGLVGAGVARSVGYGEWESWTKTQGLASNLVWNILRDRKGALWVAASMGLTRFSTDRPPRTWTRKDGLPGENVRWVGETADGAIWAISRPGGLVRIDPATLRIQAVGAETGLDRESLYRGYVDPDGRLWVAAAGGLFRNDRPSTQFRFVKINPPGVLEKGAWAMVQDLQGTVSATGADGLWRLRDGHWMHYGKAEGLLTDAPYTMVVAPDGSLWLRHRFDGGVDRVDFTGDGLVQATVVVPESAATNNVTSFHGFDTRGGFWRGTAKGVSLLRGGAWREFTTDDGLVSNDCDGEAFWADPDGSVWIGTSGGLSHFRPLPHAPQSATADPIVSSLEIRKHPRLVRASFSSLNYQYERLVRFTYRLDEGVWTETPERSIAIAGVGPGRHRLEIRSRVRNGPFSPHVAVAEFQVDPAWWETWWVQALCVMAGMGAIFAGISWRHRALQQRNRALECAVRERTSELEAERQRADAASAAKGQFLANMSHELRTPLNGLIGMTRLIEDAPDPVEVRKAVQLIRSSGQTLQAVINDILDFSKIEANRLELVPAPFRLGRLLETSVDLFQATAVEKRLRLDLILSTDLPDWVTGDEPRLRQVVLNLVSNALKFTEAGQIVVSAAAEAPLEGAHVVRIEVHDTGIGIPPANIPHLFTSFRQADSSISRRYGGTGLGLAIARSLVQLMGGDIDIQSQPGAGSTFGFTVRLGRSEAPAPVCAPASSAPVRRLRVLLAEDNKVNQLVGIKLLEKLGVAADLAVNGVEVVAAVMRTPYDVVLMDVQMPEMDGITATREIRTRLAPERQPFICGLSAHATTEFRELSLHEGMDAYLTKPLEFEKLRELLAVCPVRQDAPAPFATAPTEGAPAVW